jgi:hypothetical protein
MQHPCAACGRNKGALTGALAPAHRPMQRAPSGITIMPMTEGQTLTY